MAGMLEKALSRTVGWLADRRVPTPLRGPAYRAFARLTGADLGEVRPPLDAYPSLGAFFVRRLRDGVRPVCEDPGLLPSPVDGRVQAVGGANGDTVLQAKGRPYSLAELTGGVARPEELEGATQWTLYLSPRDYHRIHAPEAGELTDVRWIRGRLRSVRPAVLARTPRVLANNERVALRLESPRGPYFLVLVGALNVGRLRVVGVRAGADGAPEPGRAFERGEELGRFELGSTVVVVWPAGGAVPLPGLSQEDPVRVGEPIGRWTSG